jgi:hypothetical protein
MEYIADTFSNYISLFGLSPEEQTLLLCGEPDNQHIINEVFDLLSGHLKQDSLTESIHRRTAAFDGLSIVESLAKDPETTLDIVKQSFDQSATS